MKCYYTFYGDIPNKKNSENKLPPYLDTVIHNLMLFCILYI